MWLIPKLVKKQINKIYTRHKIQKEERLIGNFFRFILSCEIFANPELNFEMTIIVVLIKNKEINRRVCYFQEVKCEIKGLNKLTKY